MTHPAIGKSLSPDAVNDIVHFYGQKIGVAALAPHDLRRSYAKLAKDGGADMRVIQASLGHNSVQTTERYLGSCESANAGDWIKVDVL